MMQASEAELFKSKGAVINVSSIAALKTANNGLMGYFAAKAAQDKVTQVFCPLCATSPVADCASLPFGMHA